MTPAASDALTSPSTCSVSGVRKGTACHPGERLTSRNSTTSTAIATA